MRSNFKELRLEQLDRSLAPFSSPAVTNRPPLGWLRAIRQAIGLSAATLAQKVGASRQFILQQEKAESEDRITLKSLRALANALDCDLVYALVPRAGSLHQAVAARTRAKATANVLGVEHSMALENQASDNVDRAIEAEERRLGRKLDRR
jgi:predicted DNA-binding mobile mystery protein A